MMNIQSNFYYEKQENEKRIILKEQQIREGFQLPYSENSGLSTLLEFAGLASRSFTAKNVDTSVPNSPIRKVVFLLSAVQQVIGISRKVFEVFKSKKA